MNVQTMKRSVALVLTAATVMTANAGALFGRKGGGTLQADGVPVAQEISVETYQNVSCRGIFSAQSDVEEELVFAVEDQPRKGTVAVDGAEFVYMPRMGAFGKDRFTYTVTDGNGNRSRPAVVSVAIRKTRSGVTYADTADSPAAVAAQHLAECGIFTGAKIGTQYYFEPEKEVSRSEFLAMVMETAGYTAAHVEMTGFCDDAVIPAWAKAYASAGVKDGIIRGTATADGAVFRGGDCTTFNEAATILNRILNMEDVDLTERYADREAVPSWAAQAVGNMEAVAVLSAGSFGSVSMGAPVTRADAAQMLSATKCLLTEK